MTVFSIAGAKARKRRRSSSDLGLVKPAECIAPEEGQKGRVARRLDKQLGPLQQQTRTKDQSS